MPDPEDVLAIVVLLLTVAIVILVCIVAHLISARDKKVARIEIIPTKECK